VPCLTIDSSWHRSGTFVPQRDIHSFLLNLGGERFRYKSSASK
jgi:hypothetical protein